jgi:hypothetical protein
MAHFGSAQIPLLQVCNFSSCIVNDGGCALHCLGTDPGTQQEYALVTDCSGPSMFAWPERNGGITLSFCAFASNSVSSLCLNKVKETYLECADCAFVSTGAILADDWNSRDKFTRCWFDDAGPPVSDWAKPSCVTNTVGPAYARTACVTHLCPLAPLWQTLTDSRFNSVPQSPSDTPCASASLALLRSLPVDCSAAFPASLGHGRTEEARDSMVVKKTRTIFPTDRVSRRPVPVFPDLVARVEIKRDVRERC